MELWFEAINFGSNKNSYLKNNIMKKNLSARWEAKLTGWFSCLVPKMEKRKYSLMTSVKLSFEAYKSKNQLA